MQSKAGAPGVGLARVVRRCGRLAKEFKLKATATTQNLMKS